MTTYGTIPTSSSPPANLEYITRAKERIKAGLGTRRPWRLMFNFRSFNLPSGFPDAVSRVKSNIGFFQMNYAILILVILFLSLLWHPISLLVWVALMAAWLFLYFLRDEPIVLFGRLVSDRIILVLMLIITVVLLLFTGAILNIIIAVSVGVVVVLVHAAFRNTHDLFLDQEEGRLFSSPGAPVS
ncbi:PRA1 family protein F3-like [Vicia villosa]|uniref:PRA1 family protein F3-like n=1 Tax=Vicia villosa TaxID=3911 RepID=UPI00273B24FF|nr:PRA1 family protein F3-like [Vicia villosa]